MKPQRRIRVGLLLALCCALTPPAWAQSRVYKQVGPDGRITFTDKPPPDAAAPAPAAPAPPPPHAAASHAAQGSSAATADKSAAKKAVRKDERAGASAAAPPQAALDPTVDKGVSVLMGYENLVSEYLDLCLKTLPTSYKRYDGAAQIWKTKHAAVLARYPAVLQDNYTPAEQAALRRGVQERTQAMMAPISAADMGRRIKWCDDNAKELQSGKLDLARNYMEALMNYRKR